MKIFTTGGIYAHNLEARGQKMLDDLGRYLRSKGLTAADVKFMQSTENNCVILTAIVKH